MTSPAFDQLLARLIDANVEFVLVGGLAVNAWGVVRGTKDVDIVIEPETENQRRLARLAEELGGRVHTGESIAGSSVSIAALLASGDRVLIDTNIGQLDVVQGLQGLPSFPDLRAASTDVEISGVTIAVCSLAHLRAMKRAAGRTRDLADLEDLDAANPPE